MCEVIHWINTPLLASSMVRCFQDAVQDRVPHIEIGVAHINFGPQRSTAISKFTGLHLMKQFQIFCSGAVTIGAVFTSDRQCAPKFANLISIEITDVGLSIADELFGPLA